MEPEKPNDLLDWLGVSDVPNWRVARPLGSFIAVALTLLFILALIAAFAVIFHTIGTATSGTKEGINLGAGALVAAMLGAPFVVWGTFLKYQTVRYQKEGHITDRINKAVEQLGAEKTVKYHYIGKSGNLRFRPKLNPETGKEEEDFNNPVFVEETVPNIEVRIGAILSLERIAQDSTRYDNGRDHVRVMEILCAYVRGNAPVNSTKPEEHETEERKPRIDIQTLFDVLKRRTDEQIAIEARQKYRLNFEGTDLRGVNLVKGAFSGAIFYSSNLQHADLRHVDFSGVRLQGCSLNFVNFFQADLTAALLDHCLLDKPEPKAGQIFTTLGLAKSTKAISFAAAKIPSLDCLIEKNGLTFGTRDTVLGDRFEFARDTGMQRDRLPPEKREKFDQLNHSKKWRLFRFWSEYDANDGMTGYLRNKLWEHYGISGWPYFD